jgi:hypothetical protein
VRLANALSNPMTSPIAGLGQVAGSVDPHALHEIARHQAENADPACCSERTRERQRAL